MHIKYFLRIYLYIYLLYNYSWFVVYNLRLLFRSCLFLKLLRRDNFIFFALPLHRLMPLFQNVAVPYQYLFHFRSPLPPLPLPPPPPPPPATPVPPSPLLLPPLTLPLPPLALPVNNRHYK